METERIDLRKLDPSARHELRRIAVRLVKQGRSITAIAEDLGLRRPTVSEWGGRSKQGKSLADGPKGRAVGSGRRLTPEQEKRIRRDLVDKAPDQMKLSFALWNAQAVSALLKDYFRIDLPVRTVRLYLTRWGFTLQRPLQRAVEQKPEAVQQWLQSDYPGIAARAKAEGAEICWGDETAVSSVAHYPSGYAPKGQPPVLVLSQSKRERINLISAITNQGTMRFMMYRKPLTAKVMIQFLERLIRDSKRKVFLILDNLRVHHSRQVNAWLVGNKDHIELFFLPSYSPELNPDEDLNAALKARINRAEPVRNGEHLKRKVISHLRSIQRPPARIRSYFKAKPIRYAA